MHKNIYVLFLLPSWICYGHAAGTFGGLEEKNPNDPKYKQLAKEAFEKFLHNNIDLLLTYKEIRVTKVTTQIVSGLITRIEFKAISSKGLGFLLQCHSEILEQSWLQKQEIKVGCVSPAKSKLALSGSNPNLSRQSLIDKAIAEYFDHFDNNKESWRVEHREIKSTYNMKTKAGKEDINYFKVDVFASNSYGDYSYFNCSVVFGTRNNRFNQVPIGVHCIKKNRLHGRSEWADPSDKIFSTLAQQALLKFIRSSKIKVRGRYDVVVTFAVRQLAAGMWYTIHFVVRPVKVDDNSLECNSKIWEELSRKRVVTEVNCDQIIKAKKN